MFVFRYSVRVSYLLKKSAKLQKAREQSKKYAAYYQVLNFERRRTQIRTETG